MDCAPTPNPGVDNGQDIDDYKCWYSSAWVGLDGCSDNEIVRGGTEHDAWQDDDGNNYQSIYAWLYPANSWIIDNLEVSAGDSVTCEVWISDSTTAHFHICNHIRRVRSIIKFFGKDGYPFQGNSAESIVDDLSGCSTADFRDILFEDGQAADRKKDGEDDWYNPSQSSKDFPIIRNSPDVDCRAFLDSDGVSLKVEYATE